jgi:hypothetical protein
VFVRDALEDRGEWRVTRPDEVLGEGDDGGGTGRRT